MTCYVANHQKASRLFKKREIELLHAIRRDFSCGKRVKAAEKLREARLKVFKSDFSRDSVKPASSWVPDEEAKKWQDMPVEKIIDQYRDKI